MDAVERGGPFGRARGSARATMRAAAPGIAFRFHTAESSPVGGVAGAAARRAVASGSTLRQARSPGIAYSAKSNRTPLFRIPLRKVVVAAIVLLTLAGCAALAHGLTIITKAIAGQALLQVAWYRTQAGGVPVAPWPWADTRPVARLSAPAQRADVLVLSGATGRTLAWGPGHLDGSAAPGTPGHAVITAHRDTHFRFLEKAALGDTIVAERPDGARLSYRIVATAVVDHRALRLSRDVAVPTLTLVTCWPFDAIAPGGPMRYVVTAVAEGSE
jgi:sortase A